MYPFIAQIGCGATGSKLVAHIAQLFSSLNLQGHYVIADPDIIENKNLRNQQFLEQEVGKKKADVLARRYRAAYQIEIASYSKSYIEDVQSLKNLFNTDYQSIGSSYDTLFLPIIISCVDNNYTRQIIHQFFELVGRCLWIDVGNEGARVPIDFPKRRKEQWNDQELEEFNNSGWSGQVVCGYKYNRETILNPVAVEFPDILTDTDEIAPSQISCSNLVASEPQRLIVNSMAALTTSLYLNEILENKTISNHISFFHAKKGYMRSVQVEDNK